MTAAVEDERISFEAYVEGEKRAEVKHEFVAGRVYAMAGASDVHVTLSGNVFAELRSSLRGGPCRVYMADMKVRVESEDACYYPDVVVTCDERDRQTRYWKSHPNVIVEVLSPSTAEIDRGRKFGHYRQLASLVEYVLVDSRARVVERYRREEGGRWTYEPLGPGDDLRFAALDVRFPVDVIYEDVELELEEPQPAEG